MWLRSSWPVKEEGGGRVGLRTMGSSLLSYAMRGQLVLTGAVNNVTVRESQSSLLLLLLALLQTIFADAIKSHNGVLLPMRQAQESPFTAQNMVLLYQRGGRSPIYPSQKWLLLEISVSPPSSPKIYHSTTFKIASFNSFYDSTTPLWLISCHGVGLQ
ncbi:hypothetical protein CMUS01_16604 [Colletotrichum musicola]|uniref:Uncharacterized protein n=1 Tax=Colletotrichum musicola TaxID=2175873 RepID=A0A8H6ILU3_9PEZI|nr:hypothetical protein CMUS01_16604 [Colletotrichum musicola]